jgi:osmotically-inducible protein OsmY
MPVPRKLLSFVAALGALAVFAGCSTTQSPERQVDDLSITAEVKSKLASEIGATTVINVDVNTTNGVVTLAGQVSSDQVRTQVEQITRTVSGVVNVNNNLQVETAQQPQMPATAGQQP